jgi:hypothetical protein
MAALSYHFFRALSYPPLDGEGRLPIAGAAGDRQAGLGDSGANPHDPTRPAFPTRARAKILPSRGATAPEPFSFFAPLARARGMERRPAHPFFLVAPLATRRGASRRSIRRFRGTGRAFVDRLPGPVSASSSRAVLMPPGGAPCRPECRAANPARGRRSRSRIGSRRDAPLQGSGRAHCKAAGNCGDTQLGKNSKARISLPNIGRAGRSIGNFP